MWITLDLHNIMHILWIKKWITKYNYYDKSLKTLYFVDFFCNICNKKLSTFLYTYSHNMTNNKISLHKL